MKKGLSLYLKISLLVMSVTIVAMFAMSLIQESALKQIIAQENYEKYDFRIDLILNTIKTQNANYQREYNQQYGNSIGIRALIDSGVDSSVSRELLNRYKAETIENFREQLYNGKTGAELEIYPFIMDMSRNVVLHPDLPTGDSSLRDLDFTEEMAIQRNGNLSYEYLGDDKWMAFKTTTDWGWTIAYAMKAEDLYSAVNDFRSTEILFMVMTVLVIAGVSLLFIRASLKPMKTVQGKISEIARGGGDLTQSLTVKSTDEIGHLSFEFNNFVSSLRDIILTIKTISQDTMAIRADLGANTQQTAGSVSQISVTITTIVEQLEQLMVNIKTSMVDINAISKAASENDRLTNDQVEMVQESVAAVNEMSASINNVARIVETKNKATRELVNTAEEGKLQVSRLEVTFKEGLASKIDDIGEFVKLIGKIASQVNLLSMNAAIEAAHAGDAGMGFAVVASEIRRLAEDTAGYASGIGGSIKGVIAAIGETDDELNSVRDSFTNIHSQVTGVADAFDEIHSNTDELSEGSREILNAMDQLNTGANNVKTQTDDVLKKSLNIIQLMQGVEGFSSEVLGNVTEISAGAEEINQAMRQVGNLTNSMGEKTESLNSQIMKFRTE